MGENFPKIIVCMIVTLLPNLIHLLPDCNHWTAARIKIKLRVLDTKSRINTMLNVSNADLYWLSRAKLSN